MNRLCAVTLGLGLLAATTAHADPIIVNLNGSPSNPNAGYSSSGFAYNPVNLTLDAGTYNVQVVGIAGGGLYDALAVYAPTTANAAYTDALWSVSFDNGASAAYTQAAIGGTVADFDGRFKAGRYNSAADALSVYSAAAPYSFTLSSAQTVSFYFNDNFGDDVGGESLAVTAVPEPASLALLGMGVLGIGLMRRQLPNQCI